MATERMVGLHTTALIYAAIITINDVDGWDWSSVKCEVYGLLRALFQRLRIPDHLDTLESELLVEKIKPPRSCSSITPMF